MGVYGSPDLSKKQTSVEEYEKQKKRRKINISMQVVVLVAIYLFLLLSGGNIVIITASYVGMLSMVYFAINFIMMIYKLIKKRSVNSEVIKLIICIVLFIVSALLT